MSVEFLYPEFEIVRDPERCTLCRVCETQCANGVHRFDEKRRRMLADERLCVNCQRCVAFCPARALKIVKSESAWRESANWPPQAVREIYKQAASGGVPQRPRA